AAASSIGDCLPQIRNVTGNTPFSNFNTPRLHLLSNCTSILPEPLSRYRIRYCDRDGLGLAILEDDEDLNAALELCKKNVLAPVKVDRVRRGNLRRGFIFKWTASDCIRCERSGGRCGFNSSSYRFSCFCPDRPHSSICSSHKGKLVVIITI
ncbi:hypothetical protein ACH5RR_030152, partial [Cinchona calisaya]